MGEVVDEGIKDGEDDYREGQRMASACEDERAGGGAEGEDGVAQEDDADEERVSAKKIGERMFGAEPGGDEAEGGEAQEERGLGANEGKGSGALLIEVSGFPELGVGANFLEASDALGGVGSVWVEDVVIAAPKFERKAGANGYEAVEAGVVADGPGQAAEDDEKERERREKKGRLEEFAGTDRGPDEIERQRDE